MIQAAAIAKPAIPADPARPSNGERASARPPKRTARKPTQRAKPAEDSSEIESPSEASPKTFELNVSMTVRTSIASASSVRCAPTFSSAMRRLPNGAAATKSRLPRRASPARVPERAKTDHRAVPSAKIAPYLKVT